MVTVVSCELESIVLAKASRGTKDDEVCGLKPSSLDGSIQMDIC